MVKLKNRSGQMRVYNLTHAYYCGEKCFCRVTRTQQVAKTSSGQQGYKRHLHLVPDVLTIVVNGEVEVQDSALRVPEIARDVEARLLTVAYVAKVAPVAAGTVAEVTTDIPVEVAPAVAGTERSRAHGHGRARTR
jgi:hypothetical protein